MRETMRNGQAQTQGHADATKPTQAKIHSAYHEGHEGGDGIARDLHLAHSVPPWLCWQCLDDENTVGGEQRDGDVGDPSTATIAGLTLIPKSATPHVAVDRQVLR